MIVSIIVVDSNSPDDVTIGGYGDTIIVNQFWGTLNTDADLVVLEGDFPFHINGGNRILWNYEWPLDQFVLQMAGASTVSSHWGAVTEGFDDWEINLSNAADRAGLAVFGAPERIASVEIELNGGGGIDGIGLGLVDFNRFSLEAISPSEVRVLDTLNDINAFNVTFENFEWLSSDGWFDGPNQNLLIASAGATLSGDQIQHTPFGFTRDAMIGGSWNDTLKGRTGEDMLFGAGGNDHLQGDDGHDTLSGGTGNDVLLGGTGSDRLYGNQGNDILDGGAEHDILDGGAGDDVLKGGTGNDSLTGGAGMDQLDGQAGDDVLRGGDGNDALAGRDGSDQLFGDGGGDLISAGEGADVVDGGAGNDKLAGEGGNDIVRGGQGADQIDGGAGNDELLGGFDNDRMQGREGDDIVNGGSGADDITLGGGADVVFFDSYDARDLVRDFLAGTDRVGISRQAFGGGDLDILFEEAATGPDAVFLYDASTGLLSFDFDGIGEQAAQEIASFFGKPALSDSDFFFV